MSPAKVRVLLADDHAVVRQGLRLVLELERDFQVVSEARDGAEAVQLALSCDIELAILDVAMPKRTGIQAAREITRYRNTVKVILLSMHDDEQHLYEALRAGAAGYVLKSSVDRELVAACRSALRGDSFVYPAGLPTVVRDQLARAHERGEERVTPISPRETEVVKLVAEGHSSKAIAEILSISEKTVERHRSNIFEKLGLSDRVALTRYAIRQGLIDP